ncbi:hypothetical protein M9458_052500 [Cirrhinus mrigala]|uniref:Uncharacterized protein n=1 Tax=Cirrhinus mrigala TaxID=683832 RepID=A0ABD0MRX1_CIRMR
MRDNLIFSGIPEQIQDNPEHAIKEFMHSNLKIPKETVEKITFHRVHHLSHQNNQIAGTKRPQPIVAKFKHYKHKELVKSKGKELRGTHYGIKSSQVKLSQALSFCYMCGHIVERDVVSHRTTVLHTS